MKRPNPKLRPKYSSWYQINPRCICTFSHHCVFRPIRDKWHFGAESVVVRSMLLFKFCCSMVNVHSMFKACCYSNPVLFNSCTCLAHIFVQPLFLFKSCFCSKPVVVENLNVQFLLLFKSCRPISSIECHACSLCCCTLVGVRIRGVVNWWLWSAFNSNGSLIAMSVPRPEKLYYGDQSWISKTRGTRKQFSCDSLRHKKTICRWKSE